MQNLKKKSNTSHHCHWFSRIIYFKQQVLVHGKKQNRTFQTHGGGLTNSLVKVDLLMKVVKKKKQFQIPDSKCTHANKISMMVHMDKA